MEVLCGDHRDCNRPGMMQREWSNLSLKLIQRTNFWCGHGDPFCGHQGQCFDDRVLLGSRKEGVLSRRERVSNTMPQQARPSGALDQDKVDRLLSSGIWTERVGLFAHVVEPRGKRRRRGEDLDSIAPGRFGREDDVIGLGQECIRRLPNVRTTDHEQDACLLCLLACLMRGHAFKPTRVGPVEDDGRPFAWRTEVCQTVQHVEQTMGVFGMFCRDGGRYSRASLLSRRRRCSPVRRW